MKKIVLFLMVIMLSSQAHYLDASAQGASIGAGSQGLTSASKVWYAINAGFVVGCSWLAYRHFQALERFYKEPLVKARNEYTLADKKYAACDRMQNRVSDLLKRNTNSRAMSQDQLLEDMVQDAQTTGNSFIVDRTQSIRDHFNNSGDYGWHSSCKIEGSKRVCNTIKHLGGSLEGGIRDFALRQKEARDRALKKYEDYKQKHRENKLWTGQVRRYVTGSVMATACAVGIYGLYQFASSTK